MAETLNLGNGNWAVKKDSLLAYNSENGNFKPLPFSFSRASSATVVNKDGLIEIVGSGEARIDFKDDAKGALLLEPTRMNSIVNSQSLSLTPIKNGTFTDNFAISPDGTQNASKFTAPSSDPYFYQSVSFAAASYTASIYVKGIGGSIGKDFRIVLGAESTNPKLIIPSEWTRFEYTVTMPSGSYNAGLEIADPAVVGDEVLIWGWQLEQGSYATSYIPTQGSAVTRVADVCNNAGNDQVINSTEGVLYAEIKNDIIQQQTISLRQGTADSVQLGLINGNIRCAIVSNNSAVLGTSSFAYNNGLINKYAIVWNGTNAKTFINGQLTNTITTLSPLNLNNLGFNNPSLAENMVGICKDLRIYNTALTNAELIALTTI